MKSEKEFDRSVCYQHFEEFHKQIMNVKDVYGVEKAFQLYQAIAEYGLYEKEITDKELLILVGEPTLKRIDTSQENRERSFSGREDMEMTKRILIYHHDHPDHSQNTVKTVLGISKGKVNNVFRRLKDGVYDDILDSIYSNVSDSNSSNINGVTVTIVTDGSKTVHTEVGVNPSATASQTMATLAKQDYEQYPPDFIRKVKDYWYSLGEDIKQKERINACKKEFGISSDVVSLCIDLSKALSKDHPIEALVENEHCNFERCSAYIEEMERQKELEEEKKFGKRILLQDGNYYSFRTKSFEIPSDCYSAWFTVFTDPDGEYKFDYDFTVEWFTELGWDGVIAS